MQPAERILIVAPRYHTNLIYSIESLKSLGYRVKLFVIVKGMLEDYSRLNPDVIQPSFLLPFLVKLFNKFGKKLDYDRYISYFIPSLSWFHKHLREYKPSIIFLRSMKSFTAFAVIIIAKLLRKRLYLLRQTTSSQIARNPRVKFNLYLLKHLFKIDLILTPIDPNIGRTDKKMAYLPFCIYIDDYDKRYFKNDKVNILDAGKYVPRKDHLTLLKAFFELSKRYDDLTLTIVGLKSDVTYYKAIRSFIVHNKLEDRVRLLQNLSYSEMINSYKDFDLFILPSYKEPAAYSILEAMANKLAVICSDDCGTKVYIKPGYNGYIFTARDHIDLALKIERITSDRKKIVEFGNNSFHLANKLYSIDAQKKTLAKFLN